MLGDTLASTHDLQRILRVILHSAIAATGARAGVVLLRRRRPGCSSAQCAEGLAGRWPADDRAGGAAGAVGDGRGRSRSPPPGSRGGAGSTAGPRRRRGAALPHVRRGAVRRARRRAEPPARARRRRERPPAALGVLALYDRLGADEFDDADLVTLRTFAGQAAVAVDNVRVHEEAQRLSLTDPLTGLWNYRYLRESLRREVERASRFGRMLSVLALDLDRFKDVNDTLRARRRRRGAGRVRPADARRDPRGRPGLPAGRRGVRGAAAGDRRARRGDRRRAARRGGAGHPGRSRRRARRDGRGRSRYRLDRHRRLSRTTAAPAQQVLDAADDALYAAKAAGRDGYRVASAPETPARTVRCGRSPCRRAAASPATACRGPATPRPDR